MTTRRRLAATALPMLLVAAAAPRAMAKSLGPATPEACRPGQPAAACTAAKARLLADGGKGDAGSCLHCAGLLQGKHAPGGRPV